MQVTRGSHASRGALDAAWRGIEGACADAVHARRRNGLAPLQAEHAHLEFRDTRIRNELRTHERYKLRHRVLPKSAQSAVAARH